jgi:hypothetical protein
MEIVLVGLGFLLVTALLFFAAGLSLGRLSHQWYKPLSYFTCALCGVACAAYGADFFRSALETYVGTQLAELLWLVIVLTLVMGGIYLMISVSGRASRRVKTINSQAMVQ